MIADLLQMITDVLTGSVSGILGFANTAFETLIYDPTLNAGAGGFTNLSQFAIAMGVIGIILALVAKFTNRF